MNDIDTQALRHRRRHRRHAHRPRARRQRQARHAQGAEHARGPQHRHPRRASTRCSPRPALPSSDVGRFVYASTYVTNLFVEGKEGGVGLLTTAGFRDVLEIGRASRKPDVYDIHWRPARPLVPRNLRHDVVERIDHRGQVLTPLDEDSARAALRRARRRGRDEHRGVPAACVRQSRRTSGASRHIAKEVCPALDVSLSSDVVREFREFERTSTTCVNAFIRGPIARHLAGLGREARAKRGIDAPAYIMQGNGGVSTFASASRVADRGRALGRDGRHGRRHRARRASAACATSSRSTWAAPAPTSR